MPRVDAPEFAVSDEPLHDHADRSGTPLRSLDCEDAMPGREHLVKVIHPVFNGLAHEGEEKRCFRIFRRFAVLLFGFLKTFLAPGDGRKRAAGENGCVLRLETHLDEFLRKTQDLLGAPTVVAPFPDAWEDFRGDPLAECPGFRFAGFENQRIEPGFVDEKHFLRPARGIMIHDTLFVIVETEVAGLLVTVDRVRDVAESQRLANVLGKEPRIAVLDDVADDGFSEEMDGDVGVHFFGLVG